MPSDPATQSSFSPLCGDCLHISPSLSLTAAEEILCSHCCWFVIPKTVLMHLMECSSGASEWYPALTAIQQRRRNTRSVYLSLGVYGQMASLKMTCLRAPRTFEALANLFLICNQSCHCLQSMSPGRGTHSPTQVRHHLQQLQPLLFKHSTPNHHKLGLGNIHHHAKFPGHIHVCS